MEISTSSLFIVLIVVNQLGKTFMFINRSGKAAHKAIFIETDRLGKVFDGVSSFVAQTRSNSKEFLTRMQVVVVVVEGEKL